MKKKCLILGCLSLAFNCLQAQMVNNGANFVLNSGAVLYIDNNYVHNGGLLLNNGGIIVKQNWFNNDAQSKVFVAESIGKVTFSGHDQLIGGSFSTQFPQLAVDESFVALNVNTDVLRQLDLKKGELAVESNKLTLLNPDANSLTYNAGFVSTYKGGVFIRKTNSKNAYHFPLATGAINNFYPLTIKPKGNGENTFATALVNKDANMDGYTRNSKRLDIDEINDKYYYSIAQPQGVDASDIDFYVTSNEQKFNWVANWADDRIWEKVAQVTAQNISSVLAFDKILTYSSVTALSQNLTPFTLIKTASSNSLTVFNAFSPDGDGKNDTWEIKNIDAYPDNEVKIFDRSGNMVYRMAGYTKAKAWDGQDAVQGTYFYIVRVKINGENQYLKGAITVVKK
jgi:gliding motility-associated-like protein